jgi:hypothetical protein
VEGAAGLRIGGARSSWARGAGGQRVSCFTGLLRMTRSVFGAGGSETAGSGRGVTRGSTRRITGLACRASSGARRERSRCSKLSTRGVRSLVRKVSQLSRERWRPSAGFWHRGQERLVLPQGCGSRALRSSCFDVLRGVGLGSAESRSATRSLEFEYAEALRAGGAEDPGSSRA